MKITITGDLGSGKSTVAKILAKKLGVKRYSVGDFMGEIAIEKGMSLMELSRIAETDPAVDATLDNHQIKFGKKNDNFILDSRLGWHFIPDSFKVYIDCDLNIAAVRVFGDPRPDEKENKTLDATKRNMVLRTESERKRYHEYYGVDPYRKSNYDFVVDSTNISAQHVADRIVLAIEEKKLK